MVVVRSVRIVTSTALGRVHLELRQYFFYPVHHLDDIGTGLPLDVDDHRRPFVHPGGQHGIFDGIRDVRHISQNHGSAVGLVGDDERPVIFGGEQLVVGIDFVSLLWAVEIAQGLIDAGLLKDGAEGFEIDAIGRKGGGIGLNAHGGLLPAADGDEAHAGNLRDLLRQARVRQVFNLGKRIAFRRQRQRQDGCVSGV